MSPTTKHFVCSYCATLFDDPHIYYTRGTYIFLCTKCVAYSKPPENAPRINDILLHIRTSHLPHPKGTSRKP